ncbi:hypothetical protein WJX73_000960 [Symbiochloris irregularis]|uniref:Alkyl transferase n=1 Tax=Symbiochloris irregularis TaxID=706552 RepID=A0AAW1PNA2_9CHLO
MGQELRKVALQPGPADLRQSSSGLKPSLTPDREAHQLPRHIAVIMDGNSRWARQQCRPAIFGHRQGVQALQRTIQLCKDCSIQYLTVYGFSTENWCRDSQEALQRTMARAEQATAGNAGLVLTVAVSYGGRSDLAHAAASIAHLVACGDLHPSQVTEQMLASHLSTGSERLAEDNACTEALKEEGKEALRCSG